MTIENPIPKRPEKWLKEIARAYKDACEAIPFGPCAGTEITADNLFHLAPAVCLKFRGIKRSRKTLKKVTEAALSSYVATQDSQQDIFTTPEIAFAFCYLASHYGLNLVNSETITTVMDYVQANQAKLCELTRDFEENIEAWEADYYYLEKEDWPGLLRYRKQVAKQNPNDHVAQWRVGEAYVLNKEYEKAIHILSDLHKEHPKSLDVQYTLLDALFAIGKDENDYDWIEEPSVIRLNKEFLNTCYEYLRPRRKPRRTSEILLKYDMAGYITFDENQLRKALMQDKRFVIQETESTWAFDCLVSARKKERGDTGPGVKKTLS